jgi:hypothetical protein
MVQRHAAATGQQMADDAGPDPTEPHRAPATMDEAAANVRQGLGPGAVKWERGFRQVRDNDGAVKWVDTTTGQMYDRLPRLHDQDGGDT